MLNKNRFILALLLLISPLFLSSCYNSLEDLSSRERELRNRHTINSYLALEYLQYSRELENKEKRKDSQYFATKGIIAAKNQEIYPEVPERWKLDITQIEQATFARQKLVALLYDQQAKKFLKPQLSHLQLLYDCWISREKDIKQLASMSRCKILFFKLEDEIHKYLAKENSRIEDVKIIKIIEPELSKFEIYFDLNSHKFNSAADIIFVKLSNYLSFLNGNYSILIVGNTDRSGKKLYNDILARKRALSVKNRLMKNGIVEDLVTIQSFGEKSPEIATNANDRNRNNRLATVYILKGKDQISEIPLPLIENFIYKKRILDARKLRGKK
ncbi:MAG: outer membrane protein OmpA-like peptidoglycan-associated protein [Lentimonas sp.]|jgi:outer membrane protein OmpA-like peptidoglycan-associated protein